MKKKIIVCVLLCFSLNLAFGQQWMTSLEMAKRMALSNNKMILMVWEESVLIPYPGYILNENGVPVRRYRNIFADEEVSKILWDYFVPVIVSDHLYGSLYTEIEDKRSQDYIDKFNDDGFKVMDPNGNIININELTSEYFDITNFIGRYGFNTEYLEQELLNYRAEKSFYSAFYLAERYIDFATFVDKKVSSQVIDLSSVYLNEAKVLLETEALDNKEVLRQRCAMMELKQYLVLGRPRKVLRELDRMEDEPGISPTNEGLGSFLYYTAYMLINKVEEAEQWKSKVSLVDLKKVQAIINVNNR